MSFQWLMSCAVVLPFIAAAQIARRVRQADWRETVLMAAPIWGAVVVVLSEVLSALHAVSQVGLLLGWLSVIVAVAFVRQRSAEPSEAQPLARSHRALVAGIAVLLAVVGLTGLLSAPNNYDSMVYHLPRVLQWLQHRDLEFFPTSAPMQLHHFPGGELIILQLHGLSGSDRFDALGTWAALGGCAVGVSLLARELGANRQGQILAAVVCVTLPQGLLYASSTKNDFVAAFWLVCAVFHTFRFGRDRSWASVLGLGLSLGLAALTKVTIALFAAPLLLMIIFGWDRATLRATALRTPIVAGIALALVASHLVRNHRFYGSPLGPVVEMGAYAYGNETHAPSAIFSGVLRNVGLHLATPSDRLNALEEKAIRRLVSAVGADPDDPRTTWPGTRFELLWLPNSDARAGNLLQLLLFAFALGFLLRGREHSLQRRYAAGIVIGFVLFSAVLRWQPWHIRLQLPLFVVGAALTAAVWSRVFSDRVTTAIGVALILVGVPTLLFHDSRPLVGPRSVLVTPRAEQYFNERPEVRDTWGVAASWAAKLGCDTVGLDAARDYYMYPVMQIITAAPTTRVLDLVGVLDESAKLDRGLLGKEPCAVVCLNCATSPEVIGPYTQQLGPPQQFGTALVFSKRRPEP